MLPNYYFDGIETHLFVWGREEGSCYCTKLTHDNTRQVSPTWPIISTSLQTGRGDLRLASLSLQYLMLLAPDGRRGAS